MRDRAARAAPAATSEAPLPLLRLGFARGIAPSKWADRWAAAVRNQPLELVPLALVFGSGGARFATLADVSRAADADADPADVPQDRSDAPVDVLLERAAPGEVPEETADSGRTRHALRLYDETIALVLPRGHELAEQDRVTREELGLVRLLDHPDHADAKYGWPDPQPWQDASWKPRDAVAALDLVATGAGAILLPQPLARHLGRKREHVIVPLATDAGLAPSTIWATWSVERDAPDVQHLVGIMRGRTPRSSR